MKILLFTDSLGAGGAQRQLVGLAEMLNSTGICVKVCYYYNDLFYSDILDRNAIRHELIANSSNPFSRVIRVFQFFRQEHPDYVIAYQETPSFLAALIRAAGIKYRLIVSERNTTQQATLKDKIRFFLYRWAHCIVPNSYTQGKYLLRNYEWMKKKVTVITNYVDPLVFYPGKHVKKNRVEIVVAASIWNPKNTLGLIEAINLLNKSVPISEILHVSWYGINHLNIKYYEQCLAKINEYSLSNIISLKAKTHNFAEVYHSADYLCLPSFYEGTPNVICEAMTTGLPVICSDVCDNNIYVKESITGFLFNPRQPQSIADAIDRAIRISDMDYQRLCKNCIMTAQELFSKERFLTAYLSLIN